MATVVGHWGGGRVWCVTSGVFQSNAYFCEANVPGGAILIDAGLDGPAIDDEMVKRGLRPHQVFCTHGHFDHAGSAAYFQKKYGCQVFIHKADARTLKSSNFLLMVLKIPHRIEQPDATYIDTGFSIDVGGHALRYLFAPGHTPGSCVIEFGTTWFTGDTIYSRGVGLSSMPGEDPKLLKKSILHLWGGITAGRLICPGHGESMDGATVRGENRALLNFLVQD
jgi:glyoxylase-like metal-dependent hydrolase (beta-lactamase superfamily II)